MNTNSQILYRHLLTAFVERIKYSKILWKLTAGSRPAIPEYAKAWGITVNPTVRPATKSPTASCWE